MIAVVMRVLPGAWLARVCAWTWLPALASAAWDEARLRDLEADDEREEPSDGYW